ncbi:hypothetical protein D3C81_1912750 [compost metagenome]
MCTFDGHPSTFALRIILKKVRKNAPGREGTRQGSGRRLAGLAGGLAGSGLRGPEGIGHRCGSGHAAGQAPGLVTHQLLLVLRGSRATAGGVAVALARDEYGGLDPAM